jgi:ribosomal protein L32
MGVPKGKTPKAKQLHRRSHHHLKTPQIIRDPRTGAWKVNHRASTLDRDRKGRPLEPLEPLEP